MRILFSVTGSSYYYTNENFSGNFIIFAKTYGQKDPLR